MVGCGNAISAANFKNICLRSSAVCFGGWRTNFGRGLFRHGKMKTSVVKSNGRSGDIAAINVSQAVRVPKLKILKTGIVLIGDNPVIVHNWSKKAEKQLLDGMTGEPSAGKEPKDPVAEFFGSLYVNESGEYCIPAVNFKAAAVSASNDVELVMTEMRRAFHVNGELVKIDAPPLAAKHFTEWDEKYKGKLAKAHKQGASMRRDFVRLPNGRTDIRFRACFPIWSVQLEVKYNEAVISIGQLIGLFEAAGFGCGVCEWRPSSPKVKSGSFGTWHVSRGTDER